MINAVCEFGPGRVCTNIADYMIKNGNDVRVAYGRGNAEERLKNNSIKINSRAGVYLDGIETRIFDNAGFNSRRATKKFINNIKGFDPDIIHLHNIHGYYVNIEELFNYISECKKKVVWTFHDCWPFTGHCAYFTRFNCEGWLSGCKTCRHKRDYPQSFFCNQSEYNYTKKRELFTSVDKMIVVTPSEWMGRLVKKSFFNKYPIKTINVGVNTQIFKCRDSKLRDIYHLNDKKIILGVAARWTERKGYKDFIELSKRLGNDYQVVMLNLAKKQIKHSHCCFCTYENGIII